MRWQGQVIIMVCLPDSHCCLNIPLVQIYMCSSSQIAVCRFGCFASLLTCLAQVIICKFVWLGSLRAVQINTRVKLPGSDHYVCQFA